MEVSAEDFRGAGISCELKVLNLFEADDNEASDALWQGEQPGMVHARAGQYAVKNLANRTARTFKKVSSSMLVVLGTPRIKVVPMGDLGEGAEEEDAVWWTRDELSEQFSVMRDQFTGFCESFPETVIEPTFPLNRELVNFTDDNNLVYPPLQEELPTISVRKLQHTARTIPQSCCFPGCTQAIPINMLRLHVANHYQECPLSNSDDDKICGLCGATDDHCTITKSKTGPGGYVVVCYHNPNITKPVCLKKGSKKQCLTNHWLTCDFCPSDAKRWIWSYGLLAHIEHAHPLNFSQLWETEKRKYVVASVE